jgi:hypothetical protein
MWPVLYQQNVQLAACFQQEASYVHYVFRAKPKSNIQMTRIYDSIDRRIDSSTVAAASGTIR